ncbi:MAG: NAD-dependent epimerase/dehydratase family protein [Methanomassiliicoccales archaeon]|nr:NAD-dependent epimerase/dehydratase family protein [Methanomassiliicoccales archaeon]
MKAGSIKGNRVLVTGGAGFIGSHIAEALSKENEVLVLDDLSAGNRDNLKGIKAELLVGSIRDADLVKNAMEGVDYVFHHAAIASVPRSVDDPIASNQVNVCGTLRVLTEARQAKVRKVVFASSSAVYGNATTEIKRESDNPDPISPYAVTKLTGEGYCRNFWLNYGLATCSLRYFNVYGPRQDPSSEYAAVVPKFIQAVKGGEKLRIFGDGGQTRDFVYVADVVQANILAALDQRHDGEVFNVGRQEGVTVNDLSAMVLGNFGMGIEGHVEHLPVRKGDVRSSLADISKAKRELGYRPQYSMAEGISLTARSMN